MAKARLPGLHFKAVGGLPCGWLINSLDGTPMKEPKHPVLADGKVRYVGDRVALVVAETLEQAKAAAQLIEVDYDELPPVISPAGATSAPANVHDDAPGNLCYHWGIGDKDGVAAAFQTAAHITTLKFKNNRLAPNAMEPRCANASYSRADDNYTLYVANQNPHVERLLMCAFVLGIPEHKMRVVAPDVGGGFGSKIFLYGEETALVFASKLLNRPIKWTSERGEAFLSDYIFEPSPEVVLARLLPRYIEMQIYEAILQNAASFQSAQINSLRYLLDGGNCRPCATTQRCQCHRTARPFRTRNSRPGHGARVSVHRLRRRPARPAG